MQPGLCQIIVRLFPVNVLGFFFVNRSSVLPAFFPRFKQFGQVPPFTEVGLGISFL